MILWGVVFGAFDTLLWPWAHYLKDNKPNLPISLLWLVLLAYTNLLGSFGSHIWEYYEPNQPPCKFLELTLSCLPD